MVIFHLLTGTLIDFICGGQSLGPLEYFLDLEMLFKSEWTRNHRMFEPWITIAKDNELHLHKTWQLLVEKHQYWEPIC
jgi:hypothetical protein